MRTFRALQNLQDRLAEWQMEGIPFPQERIEAALHRIKSTQSALADKIVDIRVGTKSKDKLKGWNSSKLITAHIKKYKSEWVPNLKPLARKVRISVLTVKLKNCWWKPFLTTLVRP